jgi:hypothetical protein
LLVKSDLFLFIAVGGIFSSAVTAEVNFPVGKTCVAWKTKKRMFLVKKVEPVGMSCDVKTIWSRESDRPRVQIKVAIASFNSGEAERDREVVKILKGDTHPEIVITSEPLLPSAVKDFVDGKDVEIKAEIEVAGTRVNKVLVVRRQSSGGFARVEVKTAFKDFGIEPPSVGGGAVAKVSEGLDLHGQISVPDEAIK